MVTNIHERSLPIGLKEAGRFIDELGSAQDHLWPSERWPAITFDQPLQIGAKGGHGPIRYTIVTYQPGHKIEFRFDIPAGFNGTHSFELIEEGPDRVRLRHSLIIQHQGLARLTWPLIIRPLHDALLEDALDHAEAYAAGLALWRRPFSPQVRFLRRQLRRSQSVRTVPVPTQFLAAQVFKRLDYADAYRVNVPEDLQDVTTLGQQVFGSMPKWVMKLMALRNWLVKPLKLKTTPAGGRPTALTFEPGSRMGPFKVFERTEHEIVMGDDDRHLNFRVSVLLEDHGPERWATITTLVHFNNWLGRAYFLPVRPFHRLIVKSMLRQFAQVQ